MSHLGKSVPRVDALGKVTGETLYPGDINMPNQAHMKILFAGRPHAIIRSIDTGKAEALEGVVAVFTAKDVPVNEYGLILPDQPVLCGPGSSKAYAERVRFIGDQVAVVVAEDEDIAAAACELIEVEYEDLPVVTNPSEAMKADAALIHPDGDSNILLNYQVRRGDVDKAFKEADVIIESEYRTPAQEHAYLAPEAGLGYIDGEGRVTVAVAGQWVHEELKAIAHALDIPQEEVRVIHPAIGGAFGGREDMSIQIVLALAAWRLQQRGITRPIKIVWSREESMIGHPKRHAYRIRARWGATKEGKLLAAEVEVIEDAGAYACTSTKVLGNATLMCTGPYDIPNVKIDSYAVYTNNIPGGAFRGFGGPQGAFAAESQMNKLAEALGIDSVEMRLRNAADDDTVMSTNSTLPKGVTFAEVIETGASASGWNKTKRGWQRNENGEQSRGREKEDDHLRRGIGFAAGFKNIGFSFGFPERCWATIELHGGAEIEKVVLHHAGSDVGQGSHTVFKQMAAEAVGVPIEMVEMLLADSAHTGDSGSASASRMTFMAGNAIRGAAEAALEKWEDEDRPAIAEYNYVPPVTTPFTPGTGESENPNFAYGYVAETVTVEVDTESGHVNILEVVCADDVGKAINPQQIVGQIEGAIVQAAGYTILENFIQEEGYTRTPHLSNYLIPTVLDIPEKVESIIIEHPDEVGPWGVRGMAEMPYIPFAPAVIAAVHDATGVWFDEFPLTPERILRGLGKI
ncbi:MAG: xanthine dehydrogenase family protein molybdopterin-binding subunit [Chloroflexi bacterium]|nr:xanthine dehydrogenase family protein molybdopterin-binding subunit [Chloroflexota bacterium]